MNMLKEIEKLRLDNKEVVNELDNYCMLEQVIAEKLLY